jgi:inner membrane protein
MEAWGSQLIEAGPIIAIPGTRTSEIRTKTEKDGEKVELVKTPFTLIIAPEKLIVNGDFKTEVRKRGIFSVPLFSGELRLTGSFDPSMAMMNLKANETLSPEQTRIIIALSNSKGIRKINASAWNGGALFFQPGNQGHGLSLRSGIFAFIRDFSHFSQNKSDFDINISIQGGQYVRFLPIAQDTAVKITADWGSPSFQGAFLPGSSTITERDFSAEWDINYLSRNIPLFWEEGVDYQDKFSDSDTYLTPEIAGAFSSSSQFFGVDFFRSIDTYALNTRAVKYAALFLMAPFLTLFLLEIFAKRRIHPAPYILAGVGDVVFYLLLLSLSEQMPFFTAYLAAALAVTFMLTLYSRSLLGSFNKSWYMGLVSAISYILLYAVLNAQSYALLIGSIGAFAVTALIMFLTRKLDWYGERGEEKRNGAEKTPSLPD